MEPQEIIARARALLTSYSAALSTYGSAPQELLGAGVPESTVATLYPCVQEAWQEGYERLILTGPRPRHYIDLNGSDLGVRIVRPQRKLDALDRDAWHTTVLMARALPPASPYLGEEERKVYRSLARRILAMGADTMTHVHLIVMLLHVLNSSPGTQAALQDAKVSDRAQKLLDIAESLTHEPLFRA